MRRCSGESTSESLTNPQLQRLPKSTVTQKVREARTVAWASTVESYVRIALSCRSPVLFCCPLQGVPPDDPLAHPSAFSVGVPYPPPEVNGPRALKGVTDTRASHPAEQRNGDRDQRWQEILLVRTKRMTPGDITRTTRGETDHHHCRLRLGVFGQLLPPLPPRPS